ncbi:MAG: hypothetical protein HQK96_11155 [Nitrospirae bacterium]|nr:hypothetical protein [Nitrospirota bacterium]
MEVAKSKISKREQTEMAGQYSLFDYVDGVIETSVERTTDKITRKRKASSKTVKTDATNVSAKELERQWLAGTTFKPVRLLTIEKKYQIIYCDPLWDQRVMEWCEDYFTDIQGLCDLDIPSDKDCILYLWCPPDHIHNAIKVMNAWGFEFQTSAVWSHKTTLTDCYYQQQHDSVLIGSKGHIKMPLKPKDRPPSVIKTKEVTGSRKPRTVIEHIENIYPKHNKLVVFPGMMLPEGWDLYAYCSTTNKYKLYTYEPQ